LIRCDLETVPTVGECV